MQALERAELRDGWQRRPRGKRQAKCVYAAAGCLSMPTCRNSLHDRRGCLARLRSLSELSTADESEDAGVERHASWAELFFDLVAAAGVSTLAYVLRFELDAAALGLYALLFLAF